MFKLWVGFLVFASNGRRHMRIAVLFLAPLPALMLLQARAEEHPSSPVSAVVRVAGTDDLLFGLAPAKCRNGKCGMAIRLISGRKLLDEVVLEFAVSDSDLKRHDGDAGFVSGTHLEAWTAGDGEGAVSTAIQAVKLSSYRKAVGGQKRTAPRIGLLVHQAGGFEHVKRRHDLFVVDAGRLRKVWSVQEGAGPVFSAAYVILAESAQHEDILYIEGGMQGEAEPDSVKTQRLIWDERARKLKVRPVSKLPAVIIDTFPSVEAARSAANGTCVAWYWVLPAARFGGNASAFVLAMIAVDGPMAEAEMARVCDVTPARHIGEFRPGEENK